MKPVGVIIRETAQRLSATLGEFALPYTERILEHVLDCSRTELYLVTNRTINVKQMERLAAIVERCSNHEPLDYILGATFFYDREFAVSSAVLLPRPDTELLIEQVLFHEEASQLYFADVGIGSGCISCILTEKQQGWRAVGIDISLQALVVALKNRQSDRISLVCSDLFSALAVERCFDFIVSNPPYIPTDDIAQLDESVCSFEPHGALDGGADGLEFYRALALQAPAHLKAGSALYSEIGFDQESLVRSIFSSVQWGDFRCFRDIAGHPRVIRVCSKG